MSNYYLSKKPNKQGFCTIHKEGCKYFTTTEESISLGEFNFSQEAYCEALAYRQTVNGCYCCCNAIYRHQNRKDAVSH